MNINKILYTIVFLLLVSIVPLRPMCRFCRSKADTQVVPNIPNNPTTPTASNAIVNKPNEFNDEVTANLFDTIAPNIIKNIPGSIIFKSESDEKAFNAMPKTQQILYARHLEGKAKDKQMFLDLTKRFQASRSRSTSQSDPDSRHTNITSSLSEEVPVIELD